MSYTRVLLSGLLCLSVCACKGTIDRRIDPDAPDAVGGAGLDSIDINTMADRMSKSIMANGVLDPFTRDERASFHITRLRNDSSQAMDTEMIITMIRTRLFQGLGRRVRILDRSKESYEEVMKEREAKRSGAVAANPERAGAVAGSDFVLKGTIKDLTKQSGRLKSKFFVVTFELTNLETMELEWLDEYQVKFESERSVIFR